MQMCFQYWMELLLSMLKNSLFLNLEQDILYHGKYQKDLLVIGREGIPWEMMGKFTNYSLTIFLISTFFHPISLNCRSWSGKRLLFMQVTAAFVKLRQRNLRQFLFVYIKLSNRNLRRFLFCSTKLSLNLCLKQESIIDANKTITYFRRKLELTLISHSH